MSFLENTKEKVFSVYIYTDHQRKITEIMSVLNLAHVDMLVLAVYEQFDKQLEFVNFKNITRLHYNLNCNYCSRVICLHPIKSDNLFEKVYNMYQEKNQ